MKKKSAKTGKSQPSTKSPPTFLYGRFHFEEQFRQALIKRGPKLLHLLYLDDNWVKYRIAPVNELRYLREEANSDDDPNQIKRRARQFTRKSPLTGLKREMTKKARGVLDEILDL